MSEGNRPTIGVIVDHMRIARWQAEALRTIAHDHDLIIYNCVNSRPGRRSPRHAFYYLLNLWAVRNSQTRRVALPGDVAVIATLDFESILDGTWQRFPGPLLTRILADRPRAIVKFGMGLLKVPPPGELPVPILSYHHGDPRAFRGRPAGFYELLEGRDRIGQVVQLLSNELDSGAVAAFAETKVHRHSYRTSLVEAYRASPLLLRPAIANATTGKTTAFGKGKAYRLPPNRLVARFCLARLGHGLARLWYGAFVEKRWQVAEADSANIRLIDRLQAFPAIDRWSIVPTPPGYSFIADPFYHPDGGILVEGLENASGRGQILHLRDEGARRLTESRAHWSYPATLTVDGKHFIVPEIAESASVRMFRLGQDALQAVPDFAVEGSPHLIDPTLAHHEGKFYLFGNRLKEGSGILRLWVGERVIGPFVEHPHSPLRISPAGSRMAGGIVADGSSLFRAGQDFSRGYGDGIVLFEIERLSPSDYREVEIHRVKFEQVRGPHTLNVQGGRLLFDFYHDEVSPLAGWRRLRARLANRRHFNGLPA